MSTARPEGEDATADALATARFVRVVAAADGDSLAAAGLLARACDARDVPFQVRVGDTAPAVDDGLSVAVGLSDATADVTIDDEAATPAAYTTARTLGTNPDPVLALAGTVAAGETPETAGDALQVATGADRVHRRPGVAVPTGDLADGLACSTLLCAPFSGDVESARATLAEMSLPAELDDEAHRRVASVVAMDVATAADATPRAAETVERALHPYATPGGPFETVGGYADVLDAVAREAPGVGVALALGADVRTDALDAWRRHAAVAHRLLRDAEVVRHQGLSVARVDASADERSVLPTVARLFRDFRAPEPVALVVAEDAGAAAAASVDEVGAGLGDAMATAARQVGGDGRGRTHTGTARFDETDAQRFTDELREVLR